jgi:hypothetical protein
LLHCSIPDSGDLQTFQRSPVDGEVMLKAAVMNRIALRQNLYQKLTA